MKLQISFHQLRWIAAVLVALAVTLVFLSFFSPPTSPGPTPKPVFPYSQNLPLPPLSAKNFFILDLDSRLVLAAKDADAQIHPASTTKMMTALVTLDAFPLDHEVTIPNFTTEGSKAGLVPGETVTIDKLFYALLVQSGNDAAEVLAAIYPGGRSAFVEAMNTKAAALRLRHTQFKNPTGLDEDEHLSSAADLVRLAIELEDHAYLARIVSTENAIISSSQDVHILTNVNQLLGNVPGVMGIKTGFTDLAGESLITLVNRNGHPVYVAVMGSTDRFGDTKALIDWIYSNYSWQN